MGSPDFLDLPARQFKLRTAGLTHVLDKGMPVGELRGLLDTAGDYIDLWKFGWGTAYLDSGLGPKLNLLGSYGVRACVGGTLLEVAWLQGQAGACLAWAADVGFPCVEVSNGAVRMPLAEKRRLIESASRQFTVLAEVGSKDPSTPVSASDWADEMMGDLSAGAVWVLAEGRESGTVGLYAPDGAIRAHVVDAIVTACGPERVVFEAPRKDQQAWFIRRLGPEVNLGNITPAEVIGLEALRLGLRADTIRAANVDREQQASA